MAVKEVKLSTIEEVLTTLTTAEFNDALKRNRSAFLFRGLPNVSYKLTTSLRWNCKGKAGELEPSILRNFSKYAASTSPLNSCWEQMVIGQHHGLPTRLMDWTYSPLAALHFATSGEDITGMNQHDAVVWAIDITEMNTLLPAKYQKVLNDARAYLFTIEMLDRVAKDLTTYDNDMGEDGIVLLEPPSIDQRIINQYSYFSIIPSGVEDIEQFLDEKTTRTVKYILDKEIRWQIRDMLDQCNVNERTIYPGLDGLASWIKRHYYVR